MIGGKGEERTLRTVARNADYWASMFPASIEDWRRLDSILREHCSDVGRDESEIRRSIHLRWYPDADVAELVTTALEYGEAGVDVVILGMQHPYQPARLETLASTLQAA